MKHLVLATALVVGMATGAGHAADPDSSKVPSASEILIRAAQQQLKFSGLYRGSLDGKMSPETQQALQRFQQQRGLRSTGALDDETMAALQNDGAAQVGSSAAPQVPSGAGSDSYTPGGTTILRGQPRRAE